MEASDSPLSKELHGFDLILLRKKSWLPQNENIQKMFVLMIGPAQNLIAMPFQIKLYSS